MEQDIIYMKIALKEAKKAFKNNEVPVGAVLILNNKIVSVAYNKKETSNSVLKHAELICISNASKKIGNWRLDSATMYITLEPCPMCASAIQQARISRIVYGASSKQECNTSCIEGIFNRKGSNNIVIVEKNILEKECRELLSDFFKKKRI